MKVSMITPAAVHARSGNRHTAARWARLLRQLGHRVSVEREWSGNEVDVMIALHARRSHPSIARFAELFAQRPLIVALTGTDLYRDIQSDADAQHSLALATRLIVLQELGAHALPAPLRAKVDVVYQSARKVTRSPHLASCFEVLVSGHLREEKDPFRAVAALAYMPDESRVRVTHIGAALTREMAAEARRCMAREPRYTWLGDVPQWRALKLLARSRALVVSSRMEGGANVISEAFANAVPVIASRIPGNIGMLGSSYRGYFTLGAEQELARLLYRAESDRAFYRVLARQCAARAPLVAPEREQASLTQAIEAALRAKSPPGRVVLTKAA